MGFAYWIIAGVLGCMAVAIWVDQRLAVQPARAPAAAAATAELTVAALTATEAARLLPGAAGWAVVRRDGELLATNLSRRAALLSAACVALRLEAGGDQEGEVVRSTQIASPQGTLFGAISGEGVILAALVPGGEDPGGLAGGMRRALETVDARLSPQRTGGRHARGAQLPLPGRPA